MAEFICPNQINRDYFTVDDNGLMIPKVYPASPSVTVSDTSSVNLTKTGNDIKADVILNPSTDNLAVSTPTGIFVDKKASAITILDTAGNYTGTNVEDALAEAYTNIIAMSYSWICSCIDYY
jgi:hypothetical protein